MNMRVEIPAYTDQWMQGNRYGEVMGAYIMEEGEHEGSEIFRVKLDVGNKMVRVIADHCRIIPNYN